MTYVTKSGDSFDLIAHQQMGSCKYTQALIDSNRQYVQTYLFKAGVELNIPDITKELKVKRVPPWRK